MCELTDQDGDKGWMEYHGNADGSGGTCTAAHGTGKYEGMTVNGQYVLDFWPAAQKNGFQGCNFNEGTYKLGSSGFRVGRVDRLVKPPAQAAQRTGSAGD